MLSLAFEYKLIVRIARKPHLCLLLICVMLRHPLLMRNRMNDSTRQPLGARGTNERSLADDYLIYVSPYE